MEEARLLLASPRAVPAPEEQPPLPLIRIRGAENAHCNPPRCAKQPVPREDRNLPGGQQVAASDQKRCGSCI